MSITSTIIELYLKFINQNNRTEMYYLKIYRQVFDKKYVIKGYIARPINKSSFGTKGILVIKFTVYK